MQKSGRIILIGCLAILALDTLGSLASNAVGFSYSSLFPISLLIYAVTGFLVARSAPFWMSALAGLVVGLVDATLGWGISVMIGPGMPAGVDLTPAVVVVGAAFAVLLAVIAASIGGAIGLFVGRNKTAAK